MVLEAGRNVCEVAEQLVLSPDSLRNWLRRNWAVVPLSMKSLPTSFAKMVMKKISFSPLTPTRAALSYELYFKTWHALWRP
ncbi:hypothetical protein [uncultured Desulfovibrio sp.]|uniref:hypothetical protein n=1 Tax=uncultured Desulfovibrio sp. TaxID=167968 RepID=UPI00345A3A2E